MNLKNYTSGISSDVTIARIERMLIDSGKVSGIAKDYREGRVQSLVFQLEYSAEELPVTIRLPGNVERCRAAFWADYCKTRSSRSQKTERDFTAQAEMTAWKLQQDWVEVQLSLIRLKQVEPLQVFMAYVWDGEKTYYERLQGNGFRQLTGPRVEV